MRWGYENWGSRSGAKNYLLVVVGSFNHVNHGEKVPLVGGLELTCGLLPKGKWKTDSQGG